jgi:single-stranded-DNA-specific exonuclease
MDRISYLATASISNPAKKRYATIPYMQKVWKIKERKKADLIEHLLAQRGLEKEEDRLNFLQPDYAKLHNPFLFVDMEKAVERIWRAIDNQEKVLIYSDYDADAVTANAVIYRGLKALGLQADIYIPDRFTEGYGLNVAAFEKIKEDGASLVITVDCGTNSVDEAVFCKANGIDLIITDHHEITGETPDAFALINPKNPKEKYPYHELTGVGVAFKVICGLLSKREKHDLPEGYEKWLLDLVAIGTVADCHSLIGENRQLVKYGLQVLAKTKWIGLRVLMELAGITQNGVPVRGFDTYTIGFIIAPRINAAGRIEHASTAFELLITDDLVEGKHLAQELEKLNTRRQRLTENVMSEARDQLALKQNHKILMAVGNDWPKGVVGLVAGKLTEEFSRPVLVLERGSEESTGSARSVRNFNIVDALNFSKAHLVKYGGHAAAAGFTLRNENLEIFEKSLLDFAEDNLKEEDLAKILDIDSELTAKEISLETVEKLESFEPFGMDNVKPRFILKKVKVNDANCVGKDQKHLQMTVCAEENQYFKCIAFNFGNSISLLPVGEFIDLVFELISDTWNGQKNIKLRVLDFRKAE